jgi:HD-like signal output (HDOD) protein
MAFTRSRVKSLLNTPNVSHRALSDIIALDPGFSLHVFQWLHRLSKRPREPVNKLSNAISLIGLTVIEQSNQRLTTLEERLEEPARSGIIECYGRACHAACYAADLAARQGNKEPQAFAHAALLRDIGEMALWVQAPEMMHRIQQIMAQGGTREAAALEVLGFSMEALNQQLGSQWPLPPLARDAQVLSNSYRPAPLSVMLACGLARASARSWLNRETQHYLALLAEWLETSYDQVQAEFHQYAAIAARKLAALPIPLSAFQLLQLPTDTPERKTPLPIKSSKPIRNLANPPKADRYGAERSSRRRASERPNTKSAGPISPLQQRLNNTIKEIKTGYGLQSVMFAMLSPDRTYLKARFVLCDEQSHPLKGFNANLTEPSLFTVLLKKPQALWLNAANRKKYLHMIPESAARLLCPNGFLIMSVFVRNKPIGLFYADNGSLQIDITPQQYKDFKASCEQFMRNLV